MAHFIPVAVISSINEIEFDLLQATFGNRLSLKAMWSWNGELIPTENDSFKDIDKLNDDENFAYEQLMNSNQR